MADSDTQLTSTKVRICRSPACARAVEYNRDLLGELKQGGEVVGLRFDAATRLGLDPDHAHPEEVGHGALSVITLDDIEDALRRVDLPGLELYVQAGSAALPIMVLLQAWAAENAGRPPIIRGAVLADPVSEWLIRGTLPGGLSRACEGMATLTKSVDKTGAALHTIGVQAALWSEAGGSPVHEVAFGLATAAHYLAEMKERRVDVTRAARRLLFTFALQGGTRADFAKLAAARKLWLRLLHRVGADPATPLSWHGRVPARAGAETLAGAVAVAAAEGGACVHAPLGVELTPSPGEVPDIETLTTEIEAEAWVLWQEVERAGLVDALAGGSPQEMVERAAGADRPPAGRPSDAEETSHALHRAREAAALRQGEGAARGRLVLSRLADNARANARTKVAVLLEAFTCGATLGDAARVLYQGGTAVPAIKPLRLPRLA